MSFDQLFEAIGPNLEHFGFGTLTLDFPIIMSELFAIHDDLQANSAYNAARVLQGGAEEAFHERVFPHCCPEKLRPLAVHVLLWNINDHETLHLEDNI